MNLVHYACSSPAACASIFPAHISESVHPHQSRLVQAILQTIEKDDGNLGAGGNVGESDENVEGYEKRRATTAPAPTSIFSAILSSCKH